MIYKQIKSYFVQSDGETFNIWQKTSDFSILEIIFHAGLKFKISISWHKSEQQNQDQTNKLLRTKTDLKDQSPGPHQTLRL